MRTPQIFLIVACLAPTGASLSFGASKSAVQPRFPNDGSPNGWVVRRWDDVSQPAAGVHWCVTNGVLQGSEPNDTTPSSATARRLALEFRDG